MCVNTLLSDLDLAKPPPHPPLTPPHYTRRIVSLKLEAPATSARHSAISSAHRITDTRERIGRRSPRTTSSSSAAMHPRCLMSRRGGSTEARRQAEGRSRPVSSSSARGRHPTPPRPSLADSTAKGPPRRRGAALTPFLTSPGYTRRQHKRRNKGSETSAHRPLRPHRRYQRLRATLLSATRQRARGRGVPTSARKSAHHNAATGPPPECDTRPTRRAMPLRRAPVGSRQRRRQRGPTAPQRKGQRTSLTLISGRKQGTEGRRSDKTKGGAIGITDRKRGAVDRWRLRAVPHPQAPPCSIGP